MNQNIKRLIESRAEGFHIFARDYLCYRDESDFELGEGYRFTVLVLLGPKKFLEMFRQGRLDLDMEAIEQAYWTHYEGMPGPRGLMDEERVIIRDHNLEVDAIIPPNNRRLASF